MIQILHRQYQAVTSATVSLDLAAIKLGCHEIWCKFNTILTKQLEPSK